ncbi:MAG: arylesterase [Desulfoprunum sp.]|nr:arylesterase [Desulfoprunum sp.]
MRRTRLGLMAILLLCALWACRQEAEGQKEVKKETASTLTIVAVGDSLTAGLGVVESEGYPTQLEGQLQAEGRDIRVINAGVSGETTSGTLARLDWVLTLKPDIVILETGANDGLRGLDPGLVRQNLRQIIERLQEKNIAIVFTGMRMVWNLGPAYTTDFNRIYPEIAEEKGLIFMPFFLDGVATKPTLNIEDGIHPNPQGYTIIVKNLLPFVKQAVVEIERRDGK